MRSRTNTLRRVGVQFVVFVMFIMLYSGGVSGQPLLDREHEPVIVTGSQLPEFLGFPVTYIHVYSYDAEKDEWTLVPFQVDEREDSTAASFFADHYNLFSELDEIVFMAQDMGDQAPDSTAWPLDYKSRWYVRYEIAAEDTVGTGQAFAYVYISPTMDDGSSLIPYVDYDAGNDIVTGYSYVVAHNPDTASGLPSSISIPAASPISGDGIDFLDKFRLRFNIHAKVTYSGLTVELDIPVKERMIDFNPLQGLANIKINVFQARPPDYVQGLVRVLRNMILGITIKGDAFGTPIDVDQEFSLQAFYYRTFLDFPPVPQVIPEIPPIADGEARVTKFFIGSAHNSRVDRLRYYSPDPTYPDLPIGDSYPTVYDRNSLMSWPGTTWYGMTSVPSQSTYLDAITVLSLIQMRAQPLSESYSRYFAAYDNDDGPRRYGIMGFKLETVNGSISGLLDVLIRNYYFGDNFSHQQMAEFADKYGAPLQIGFTTANYPDAGPPARVTTLAVTSVNDSSATLKWTAVGDDGVSNGPAKSYLMRYSEQPINWDQWWVWWGDADAAPNMPTPSDPGETDSVTVQGLKKNTTYYFALRTLDEQGNASDLSEAATVTTTPVELLSFAANVSNKQVRLSWATVSETNNFGFEVQRKFGADAQWQVRGFVEGAGTTNDPQSYVFVDNLEQDGKYFYRLKQIDTDGVYAFSQSLQIELITPSTFALYQNYPNPFSNHGSIAQAPETRIVFRLPADYNGPVQLKIYDLLGRQVRTLVQQKLASGLHEVVWDGKDANGRQVVSGVYVYMLISDQFKKVRKMIIM